MILVDRFIAIQKGLSQINSSAQLLPVLRQYDALKREHHQLRSQHYWDTLVDITDKEARDRYNNFLESDFELNLISSRIDQCVISSANHLGADQGELKDIINKLNSNLPFNTPEYHRSKYQEIASASRYHALKKRGPDSKIELLNLYSSLVAHRRQQAEICGFQNYRSMCEKIDGREALSDLLSTIPTDFHSRLKDFFNVPRIQEPQIEIDPLKEVQYLFDNIPDLSQVFFDIIKTGEFDLAPRATKASVRGLMLFNHLDKTSAILSNNLTGVAQYDVIAHELAHACHWTLSASQTYLEFSEPLPDFAEIIAMFFEFTAASTLRDGGETLRWKIYSRLESIFWSSRLFEFEAAIYGNVIPDVERTWAEINNQYFLEPASPFSYLGNYWMLFTQPFYYSRYAFATIIGWKLYCNSKIRSDITSQLINLMKTGRVYDLKKILNLLNISVTKESVSNAISSMLAHLN